MESGLRCDALINKTSACCDDGRRNKQTEREGEEGIICICGKMPCPATKVGCERVIYIVET